jgi:hypothetical protein
VTVASREAGSLGSSSPGGNGSISHLKPLVRGEKRKGNERGRGKKPSPRHS